MCFSIEFKGKIRFNRRPFHKHFFFSSKQIVRISWWRHQMETFSALLALRVGNSPVSGEIPAQRPVTRSVDVFFDLRLIKRLSKHWRGWWFETLSRPLWRHCNVIEISLIFFQYVTIGSGNGLSPVGRQWYPSSQIYASSGPIVITEPHKTMFEVISSNQTCFLSRSFICDYSDSPAWLPS